jgi:hypothetical protein
MAGLRTAVAVGVGAAAGLVIWHKLGSVIAEFLTSLTVTPSDPVTVAGTCGVVAIASLVACLAAVRRPRVVR